MKFVFVLAVSFVSFSAQAYDLSKILQRTLITGASVSADWAATSPGKRLARQYSRDIDTIASPGASSFNILGDVEAAVRNRTAVIALDLFFWDTRRTSLGASSEVLTSLLRAAAARNIPVVIGDVPEIFRGSQPGRAGMNSLIRSKCAGYTHCRVFPLDSLYHQMAKNRGMTIGGRFYSTGELLPDGIHPGDVASREIANRLAALLKR